MQIKRAMILAAGYGKRMLPLTKITPKPLIKIGPKNLLERSIEILVKIGVKEIVINIHHLHEEIEKFIKIKNYEISNIDALRYLKTNKDMKYDLIFVDAPYNSNLLEKSIVMLDEFSYLSQNTYIYYEQRKKDYNQKLVSIITKTHNILKDSSIGDVSYTIAKIKEN